MPARRSAGTSSRGVNTRLLQASRKKRTKSISSRNLAPNSSVVMSRNTPEHTKARKQQPNSQSPLNGKNARQQEEPKLNLTSTRTDATSYSHLVRGKMTPQFTSNVPLVTRL